MTQLASTDIPNFDAAFSMPTIDRTATAPEPVFGDSVFPTKIQTVETYADPRGQRQRLVLVAGQFAGDPSLAPGRGRQRNFTQIGARVYYAPPGATDFTPAQFGLVQGAQIGTQAAFSVHASDVGGTGVKRVVVAYHDGANWKFVDLQQSASDPTLWTGGGPSATVDPEFFVQAVDGAGNVSVTSYKGRYYLAPPPPTQTGGLAWSFAGTPGLNGWFTSNVTATVTGPAGTTLDLDGGPFGVASPLAVAGDGVHLSASASRMRSRTSRSGSTGRARRSPSRARSTAARCRSPAARCFASRVPTPDPVLTSCAATLNGNPVANGADISTSVGAKTVVVTAKDAAGNTSTKTISFQVTWPFTGWLFPIKNPPAVNRIVPGWIIPMRFRIGGNRGLGIIAPGFPTLTTTTCPPGAPTTDVGETLTRPAPRCSSTSRSTRSTSTSGRRRVVAVGQCRTVIAEARRRDDAHGELQGQYPPGLVRNPANQVEVTRVGACPSLQARGVAKSFGSRLILDGLDFDIEAGVRMGVIGPNGGGKSTLLRILGGRGDRRRG